MSDLSELIKIGKNIEAQNEEIIRLLRKIAGEEEETPKSFAPNQMMPYPENPFDFSTLAYDEFDDEEEIDVVIDVETPHFEEALDIGEVYFMEDFTPFRISVKNDEVVIDNLDGCDEPGDYHLAELVVNELVKNNKGFDESTVILPESVMGNLPLTLEKCIAEGAKKVYGPWKSMMELLNAPQYLQTKLQLDFYKTEDHLIERVFKE